jgi:hypothetical protein
MTRPIPKQHRKMPPSSDHGDYEQYRELEDVEPLKDKIAALAAHVREAWYDDEINRALANLANVNYYLDAFAILARAHRDRVIDGS